MTESTPHYQSIQHDHELPERIYVLSGAGYWQFRILADRTEHPTIHGATFDIRLHVDGTVEITSIAKNYKVTMSPV